MTRFLADEDVYAITVRWLRAAGHDALFVCETAHRGVTDDRIWDWAQQEGRVLITRDKGFGRRFVASPPPRLGIILIRGEFQEMPAVHMTLADALAAVPADVLASALLVVQAGRYRLRRS